VKLDDIAVVPQ